MVAVLESERKHVTVLFLDISQYRDIISRVDPEEIRDVTRRQNHSPGSIGHRTGVSPGLVGTSHGVSDVLLPEARVEMDDLPR